MLFGRHKISFRRRPLCWGLLTGLTLALAAFVLLLPLALPRLVQAATAADSCFSPTECVPDMQPSDLTLCKSDTGCCIGDRCFVPDKPGNVCPVMAGTQQGFCYARPEAMPLSVQIGTKKSVIDLADYIDTVYRFAIGIGGVMAATMMMIGGFLYITAADSDRVSKGKQFIVDALTGLVVILGAYLLLNTINPDLISLSLPKVPVVKRTVFVGCSMTSMCAPCGRSYGVTQQYLDDIQATPAKAGKGGTKTGATKGCDCTYGTWPNADGGSDCSPSSPIVATCTGTGCLLLDKGCSDSANSCRKGKPNEVSQCHPVAATPPATDTNTSSPSTPTVDTTYNCFPCLPDGASCSPSGHNDKCCGGFCGKNTCTAGQPGDKCNDPTDCESGICQTNWGNSCSLGEIGAPCGDSKKECKPEFKCNTNGSNTCSPGTQYSWCDNDGECGSGMVCNTKAGPNVCMPPNGTKYGCSSSQECKNAGLFACETYGGSYDICTDGSAGAPCADNEECQSGKCAVVKHVCTNGSDGSACDPNDFLGGTIKGRKWNNDCSSGRCYNGGNFSVCVSGGLGSRCKDDDTCLPSYKCCQNRCVNANDNGGGNCTNS